MRIEHNKSLQEYNTFGVDVTASRFVSVTSESDLQLLLAQEKDNKLFLLGGGSNMLLINSIDALVIHLNLKGITIVKETENDVFLKVQAGENWHDFVLHCLAHNYGGLENMSLIPGNVGTSPIQNIGAYGVELKDTFVSCDAIHIETQKTKIFSKEDCHFGYRNSIFKNKVKGQYIITSVTFQLTKKVHNLHIEYGAIKNELATQGITNPTIKDVSNAVIAIRQSKLPDPAVLGNSGSFFKNPIVNTTTFNTFKTKFPEAPYYEVSTTAYKIPAGWLIEQAGFKGKRYGDAGVHKNQALVLVNYGNASGKEIWNLAMKIQEKVKEDFGIFIEPEVNVF